MIVSLLRIILIASFGLTSALASSSRCKAMLLEMQDCSQCCCDHSRDDSHDNSCDEELAGWGFCWEEVHPSSFKDLREVSFPKEGFKPSYEATYFFRDLAECPYGIKPTVSRKITAYLIAPSWTALLHKSLTNCQNAPPRQS